MLKKQVPDPTCNSDKGNLNPPASSVSRFQFPPPHSDVRFLVQDLSSQPEQIHPLPCHDPSPPPQAQAQIIISTSLHPMPFVERRNQSRCEALRSPSLLLGVGHAPSRSLVLLLNTGGRGAAVLHAIGDFLLLLNEIAQSAAARQGDVRQARALEVVLLADVGALHRHGDEVQTEAAGTAEEKALELCPSRQQTVYGAWRN